MCVMYLQVNLSKLLPDHFGDKLNTSSLSFLEDGTTHLKTEDLRLCQMDFLALVVGR